MVDTWLWDCDAGSGLQGGLQVGQASRGHARGMRMVWGWLRRGKWVQCMLACRWSVTGHAYAVSRLQLIYNNLQVAAARAEFPRHVVPQAVY